MEYFAGLFDAEGTLNLTKKGAFPISIEMANEEIPNIFKEKFGGSIYIRKRDKRKTTWSWKINSINNQAKFFLKSMIDHSVVKQSQIKLLLDYLCFDRKDRRNQREEFIELIKKCKKPQAVEQSYNLTNKPLFKLNQSFFNWFAGLIDGDGNFVCNQYTDKRNQKKYFGHQLSFSNTNGYLIAYINSAIQGTVVKCPRNKNLLYKWTPKRKDEIMICQGVLPYLKIKKKQCELFLKFIDSKDISEKFQVIDQIKHLNSL